MKKWDYYTADFAVRDLSDSIGKLISAYHTSELEEDYEFGRKLFDVVLTIHHFRDELLSKRGDKPEPISIPVENT